MSVAGPGTAQRVIVAGASLAGLRAAEAVRRAGFSGEVVMIGAEPHLPYNRPPLSKDLASDRALPESLARHALMEDAIWRLGCEIASADLVRRVVRLQSGEDLTWDGLVIATGLRPRTLPLPGPPVGRHHLRTFFDGVTLSRALRNAHQVVIVGGGFIGCELAAATARLGLQTHLVAPELAPLAAALGEMVGGEIRRRLSALGVQFHLGSAPVRYHGLERVDAVELTTGQVITADLVVEAVGSEPNVEWLAGTGIDTSDGVLTDSHMRVGGRGDVVACGDVARFPVAPHDRQARRLEHWTVAVDTARLAGTNLATHLAGGLEAPDRFTAVPSFWSHLADDRVQSFGQPSLGLDDVRLLDGDLSSDAAIGYYAAGELVGVVLIGMASRYAYYRRAVDHSRLALLSG